MENEKESNLPRINIEDSIYKDIRFHDLLQKLGSIDAALGSVVRAWSIAQSYWVINGIGIPIPVWKNQKLRPELIEVGLAEQRGDYIYVCGSEEQFAWLVQKTKAGRKGGVKSGESRRPAPRKTIGKSAKRNEAARSGANPLLPSPVPTHIQKEESKDSNAGALTVPEREAVLFNQEGQDLIRSPIGFFIANYVNAYQQRYGIAARPSLAGKTQGEIKRFLKDTPLSRACDMIQVYLQMDDPWFLTKAHDFTTFVSNLSKIGLALDTGRLPSDINWSKVFEAKSDAS